jgi:hypothetical protein
MTFEANATFEQKVILAVATFKQRQILLNVALKQETGEENWNIIYEITEKILLQHF